MRTERAGEYGGRALVRREAIRQLALLGAGLAAACTPLKIVLHLYPEDFDGNPDLLDRVLRAFAAVVVPGASSEDPDLVQAYYDPAFPLHKYLSFLAADLCRRAQDRFGTGEFHRLTVEQRTNIVRRALREGGTTARLYGGAIFLAQIAFYAGIYDDARGCPLIGFEGQYRFRGIEATTYPDPGRFLARALTRDGNPA